MDQETYNGIIRVLQRGAGVMATEYCQAFTAVVAKLQEYIRAEQEAKKADEEKTDSEKKDKKV